LETNLPLSTESWGWDGPHQWEPFTCENIFTNIFACMYLDSGKS